MTIARTRTDGDMNTIGLAAVSSYQGWQHMVGARNADTGTQGYGVSAWNRLTSAFTYSNPLQCVGYTWNGHTALMTRIGGKVKHVVGFNPKSGLYAGAMALFTRQFTTTGEWYDDSPMLDDPTAVSHEIKVSMNKATELDNFINNLIGRSDMGFIGDGNKPFNYTFKPGDMKSDDAMNSNCGHAALQVLDHFLSKWGKMNEAQSLRNFLDQDKNVAQGKMMQAIGRGFNL